MIKEKMEIEKKEIGFSRLELNLAELMYEVIWYMLDADSYVWSMKKSEANWFRIVAVLA